uniref:Putative ovule protein n=1 Tax=Solanum chacoense TaxID=4108 RepID=A0A0V0IK50_SOLCH
MDLPPYHHQHHRHHHHRYVQPPPNFSHNPNFFHHLPPPPQPPQQRLPPPPPLSNLPPPPPQRHISHPPLPPSPSPPFHHKSQFSFPSRHSENPRYGYHQNGSPLRVSSNITLNQPPYQPPHPHPSSFHYNDHYHNPPPPPPPRFTVNDFTSSGLREDRASSVNDSQEPLRVRRDVNSKYDDDERYRLERRRMDIDTNPSRDFRPSPGNYELRDDRYEDERWEYGGNVDEVPVGSSSRRVSSLDNGNDYGDVRFSNRLRVDKEEIHRSPQKKQVQKKECITQDSMWES